MFGKNPFSKTKTMNQHLSNVKHTLNSFQLQTDTKLVVTKEQSAKIKTIS